LFQAFHSSIANSSPKVSVVVYLGTITMLLSRHLCRWLASFALLVIWLPLVAANPPAHVLEKIALYFTYRSSVIAHGEKQQLVFPGLSKIAGSHPDKVGTDVRIARETYTDFVYLREPISKSSSTSLLPARNTQMMISRMRTWTSVIQILRRPPSSCWQTEDPHPCQAH
jgi:hypothetical protein